jgi:ubiquinone/menaquinone biosynthesis C-methylase UbiE
MKKNILDGLEERKLKEIEHSKRRREILQGFERHIDIDRTGDSMDKEAMIRDEKSFKYHFSNTKFYSITHSSEKYQYSWLKAKCENGAMLLDFACGNGENGIFASQSGAETIGIDISPEGVENANKNARELGVENRCKFEVMDGENMTFPDNTFDLSVEYGALHHVDMDKAMFELQRVLKPGGEMICVEALKHNPLIHWYRKRTPHLRTEWEVNHILGVQDLDIIKKYFTIVDVKFFYLLVLLAVPFRKTVLFKPLHWIFNKIDQWLLKWKFIGKYGWIMVFIIRKPNN